MSEATIAAAFIHIHLTNSLYSYDDSNFDSKFAISNDKIQYKCDIKIGHSSKCICEFLCVTLILSMCVTFIFRHQMPLIWMPILVELWTCWNEKKQDWKRKKKTNSQITGRNRQKCEAWHIVQADYVTKAGQQHATANYDSHSITNNVQS